MSADFEDEELELRRPPQANTVTLILSLMLILLLFFVRLFLMTTPDLPKSHAVMDQVKNTFKGAGPRTQDIEHTEAAASIVVPSKDYQADIMRLFKTEFPVVDIEIFNKGNMMRITIDAEELHEKASGVIRRDRHRFLDVLAFAISEYPDWERPEIEYVIGTGFNMPNIGGKYLTSVEVGRAGAFARAMQERGIKPTSISVGMHNGDKEEIQLFFYIRTHTDAAVTFEDWHIEEERRKQAEQDLRRQEGQAQ